MTREEYYCNEFLEKIYYFCLKKTGNIHLAEDLSSEISVEILSSLNKGIVPEHMEAWIWRIARNRFARWIKNIKKQNEVFDEEEISNIPTDENIEEYIIKPEQLYELRRELSITSREYREILVAYYIENKKISTIAKSLSVPEGTIKTKLFKARIKLKEGMQMARKFGKLSYAPEEIQFMQSGGKSTENEPDKFLYNSMYERICKNILIETYRNPSTIQELSIELGIALPYLEGFVEEMTNATLLNKIGKKEETAVYETNFVIISAKAMSLMNDKLSSIKIRFIELAKDYLEKSRKLQLEAGNYILGKVQDYEEQKWTLALRLADDIQWSVYGKRNLEFNYDTKRPNNGSWDIMGAQKYEGPEFMWIGHCNGGAKDSENINSFITSKDLENAVEKELCIMPENVKILNYIMRGEYEKVSETELERLNSFIQKDDEGKYKVKFGIYSKAHNSKELRYGVPIDIYNKELLPCWNNLMDIAEEYMVFCEEVMKNEIPSRLMTQFNFCMHSIPFLRRMVIEGLLENKFLEKEENISFLKGIYSISDSNI